MSGILDTIDNAIADYELSADAMRWSPDRPSAAGGIVSSPPDLAALFDVPPGFLTLLPGVTIEPWQAEVMRRQFEDSAMQFAVALEPVRHVFAEAMKGIGLALGPILDEVRWGKPRRPSRVSQIRRAYRAKRRRW